MNDVGMDPELASEMVKLLGQELKVVRAQLREAERRTSTTQVGPLSNNAETQALIAENDSLRVDNVVLQERVARFQHELARVSSIKAEDDVEPTSRAEGEFARLLAHNEDLIREKEEASRNQEKLLILQEKHKRSKFKVHELKEALDELHATLENCTRELDQSRKDVISEIDFRHYLKSIPYVPVEGQRELSSIPQYPRPRKHPKCIEQQNVTDCCQGPYFLNHNEVIWSPSGIALGLVVKPTFRYNPKVPGGAWTKFNTGFPIGKPVDICCLSDETARYLGTYERVGKDATKIMAPQTLKYLDNEKLEFVSESTTLFPDLVPPSQMQMIKNMYKHGVIKLQCFEIRCVAFNHAFAEKLQEMGTPSERDNPPDCTVNSTPENMGGGVQKRKRYTKPAAKSSKKRKH